MASVTKGKSKDSTGGLDDVLRLRSKSRGLLNTSNLPALQNLLKRDPKGYRDDFIAQWNHYQGLRRILNSDIGAGIDVAAAAAGSSAALGDIGALGVGANGSLGSSMRLSRDEHNQFLSILNFVTHLAPSYPDITKDFTLELSDLLLKHHASLTPDIRLACAKSLVMLCHQDYIKPQELLQTLLPLLSLTTSATLRQYVQKTILMQLKNANLKAKNHALNRQVQTWLFNLMQKGIEAGKIANSGTTVAYGSKGQTHENMQKSEAMWAVKLAAELWRKNIWRDARTVQIIAEGCFHPNQKVQSSCIRFFLGDLHSNENQGSDEENGSDSDQAGPEMPDMGKLQHQRKVNRKTRGGDRKVRMASQAAKRLRHKREEEAGVGAGGDGHFNAVALDLLHDPQTFAERLFEHMRNNDKRYRIELKVRIWQLLSRIISLNSLTVLGFFSYTEKYLKPSQEHVTLILVSLAQAIHEQTPPDVLLPVVRKVSNEFVHPGVGAEVVAAGINTVREMCTRQPGIMDDAPELLSDLIEYRKSKDKGIIAASRGLLALYREVNPGLLRKAERGKDATLAQMDGKEALTESQFGVKKDEVHGIPGLELLVKHLADTGEDEGDGWDGWEVESDPDSEAEDSDDSGGWIAVSSDEDEEGINIEDSDDDENKNKQPKRSTKERAAEWKAKRREDRHRKREGKATIADEENEQNNKKRRDQMREEARQFALKAQEEQKAMVELATTRILTPADFVKLDELRVQAAEAAAKGGSIMAKRQLAALKQEAAASKKRSAADEGFIDAGDILGPRKKVKQDYEERKAMREAGREDREKFGSKKGKRNKDNPSSTTNEQKKKGKNFQMIQKSFAVRNKKKESLSAKSRRLRKAHDKEKKKY